ncbi:MAG: hypothetical protein R2684_13505 [Pyrinomonadaceae bacterium]
MKKILGLGNRWSEEQKSFLAKYGLQVAAGETSWVQFKESVHSSLKKETDTWDVMRGVRLSFTASELKSANFLAMTGLYSNGYPMPDDDFGYVREVYGDNCPSCGIPGKQIGPFSIRRPKTKRKAFTLEWVHDEIFVRREVYESQIRQLGVASREVLLYPSRGICEEFVQLDLSANLVDINTTGLKFEECPTCNERKYSPKLEDFLQPITQEPAFEIGRSVQYFGSGHGSFRLNIFSQKAKQVFVENRLALPRFFHPILNS